MAFLDVNGNGEPKGIVKVDFDGKVYTLTAVTKELNPIPFLIRTTTDENEIFKLCGKFFKEGFDVPFDYVPEDVVEECMLGEL